MAARTKTAATENGAAAQALPAGEQKVVIARISPQVAEVEIQGLTPLVVCAWSEKARQQIRDKQFKKGTKVGREAKDPVACYNASRYISTEGWDGIPAGGVKGCLVNACRAVDGLPMTLAKRMIFVRAEGETEGGQGLVRIHGEPVMHEAMVRVASGDPDLRYRAMYKEWSIKLQIEFLSNVISADQVANLLELAGYVEGLCEHRPGAPKSCTGDWGRFRVLPREKE